jgi:hypothetical protein
LRVFRARARDVGDSAASVYRILNGGELGFFGLETVRAMRVIDGRVATSILRSRTLIVKRSSAALLRYLSEQEGLQLDESM